MRCSVCLLLVATRWLGSRGSVLHCLTVVTSRCFATAVFCSVLQYVAACCNMLQHVPTPCCYPMIRIQRQRVAVCCSVVQCAAVYCSTPCPRAYTHTVNLVASLLLRTFDHMSRDFFQWLLVVTSWLRSRRSVLQCVAVCCSVFTYIRHDFFPRLLAHEPSLQGRFHRGDCILQICEVWIVFFESLLKKGGVLNSSERLQCWQIARSICI